MKRRYFLIAILQLLFTTGFGQQTSLTIDSLEKDFVSVWSGVKMPCRWVMTVSNKTDGKPVFSDKDSSILDFDSFDPQSLPFYDSSQTDFQTTMRYCDWAVQVPNFNTRIKLTKVQEDTDEGFVIFKIRDSSGDYYRLIGKYREILWSMKLYNKDMSAEQQLDKLKLLYQMNKL